MSFPHRKLGSLPSTFVGNRVAVLGDSHSDSAVSVERRGRFPSMVLAEFSAIVLSTASVLSAGWLSTFWQVPSDTGRHRTISPGFNAAAVPTASMCVTSTA